ncbi:MAG TPA: TIGR03621 family F420-dependent LLM class oxidoreductase [Methylomirabilota bacterium]|nr:TIGR03621 family F420-dependent LLM class oxidoreductase [Methylomirabilota bacterium]
MRPFRFGVNVRTAASHAEWSEKARKVEALGYSVLLVPDHLADLLAPFPALTAAAAATTRLRVGTAVLNNDFRHPVLLAREAASLDVLSDGRLELGMGAGHMRSEYEQAGLPFDAGATRVERLAESVGIVKRLLEGERVTFAGAHYRVTDHTIQPRPIQRPCPPIFIGGNAPRLLTVAAREADIVGLTGIAFRRGGTEPDVSDFRAAVVDERVKLVRETAGAREIELNALVQRVIVTDDRHKAARELATGRWGRLTPDDVLASPYALVGTVDEIVEDLRARRERWGISYVMTHEPFMDALAPVVARLAGR